MLPVIVVDASDIGLSILVSTDFSGAVLSSFSLSFVGSLLLDFADLKELSLLRAAAWSVCGELSSVSGRICFCGENIVMNAFLAAFNFVFPFCILL